MAVTCSKCGARALDGAKFCSQCGGQLVPERAEAPTRASIGSQQSTTATSPSRLAEPPELICPLCGDAWTIKKVSGIYRDQTSTEEVHSSGTTSTSFLNVIMGEKYRSYSVSNTSKRTVQSDLAKSLAPPHRPGPGPLEILGGIAGAIAWFGIWAGGLMSGIVPNRSESVIAAQAIGIFVWVMIWLVGKSFDGDRGERVKEAYEAAMERWEKAYYCSKHDVVFIGGESKAVSLGGFRQLLIQE